MSGTFIIAVPVQFYYGTLAAVRRGHSRWDVSRATR